MVLREVSVFVYTMHQCQNCYIQQLHFVHVHMLTIHPAGSSTSPSTTIPFCHTFDLSTRLSPPYTSPPITYLPPTPTTRFPNLQPVATFLSNNLNIPVRLVLPSLLSPLLYAPPPPTSDHTPFISYLLSLRRLLQSHPLLALTISWPLALYPPSHSYTRWLERLSDGVLRLEAFPHGFSAEAAESDDGGKKGEEAMQGLLRVRKLPVLTERGMGMGAGEDLAWRAGRRGFVIREFNLPPLLVEPQETGEDKRKNLEF